MDKHQLIDEIALISNQISQKNRIIREAGEAVKEVDRLEARLKPLMKKFIHQEERTIPTVLFAFNGKNKDLLEALQSQIQKAQS